jgi:peptide/nickel transport system permease protein
MTSTAVAVASGPAQTGTLRLSVSRFVRRRSNLAALAIVLFAVALALVPPELVARGATFVAVQDRFAPPFWVAGDFTHPLGTDNLGRDILARVIFAARYAVSVTIVASLLAVAIGVAAGVAAGLLGGWVDAIVSRIIDVQLAFPVIFLAIAVLAVAGSSLLNLVLVLALAEWSTLARLIRASVLELRGRDFVEAAKSIGATQLRIATRHILPNVMSLIFVLGTYSAARILLTESALGFLGLGVLPPAATWGGMVGDGRNYLFAYSWVAIVPGLIIATLVLAISFLGDGLRDAFDPRIR